MERSSNEPRRRPARGAHLDRAALVGLGAGLVLYVMPFWAEGRLRWAFGLTLLSTVVHLHTARRRSRPGARTGDA